MSFQKLEDNNKLQQTVSRGKFAAKKMLTLRWVNWKRASSLGLNLYRKCFSIDSPVTENGQETGEEKGNGGRKAVKPYLGTGRAARVCTVYFL